LQQKDEKIIPLSETGSLDKYTKIVLAGCHTLATADG
jgi:hypothetical protein